MARKITTEEFVARAREVHGDRYDYSLVEFSSVDDPVSIICAEHGEFTQRVRVHLAGRGCKKCAASRVSEAMSSSTEEFIKKATLLHGETYDYSKVVYKSARLPVVIRCREHGDFSQTPDSHLKGAGCLKCSTAKRAVARTRTNEEFIAEAESKYGASLDFSLSQYSGVYNKITARCPVHGEFEAAPHVLLRARSLFGCPECAKLSSASLGFHQKKSTETFTSDAKKVHGDRFDYSKTNYVSAHTKVTITCKTHGDFEQLPSNHLQGYGCQRCSVETTGSKGEQALYDFMSSLGVPLSRWDRSIISPLELDIVVHQKRVALEYCGLFWHSDYVRDSGKLSSGPKRHLIKLERAKAAGYRLFTVFEDEWVRKQSIVKTLVTRAIAPEKLPTIGARSCELFTPSWEEAAAFYSQYHLQGATPGTVHLGLRKGDLTLAVMTVGKRSLYGKVADGDWEMIRFCLNPAYNVPGAMSRLCSWLPAHLDVKRLFSFVDRRWFTGSSYVSAGFTLAKITDPGYWYVRGLKRESRYKYAKHKLPYLLENFYEDMTEAMNMKLNGWDRIFDCGQYRFEKTY